MITFYLILTKTLEDRFLLQTRKLRPKEGNFLVASEQKGLNTCVFPTRLHCLKLIIFLSMRIKVLI